MGSLIITVSGRLLYCDGCGWAPVDASHAHDAVGGTRRLRLLLATDLNHVVDVHGADLGAHTSALTLRKIDLDISQFPNLQLRYPPPTKYLIPGKTQ